MNIGDVSPQIDKCCEKLGNLHKTGYNWAIHRLSNLDNDSDRVVTEYKEITYFC